MTAVELNELSLNARGGTELMAERLAASLPAELLSKFQIIPTRARNLDPNRIRLLWCHELPMGPEAQHLANGGWRRYHRIVFVSHSQMQSVCATFQIPYSHCEVMLNAIVPIPAHHKPAQGVRLAYWSMPDRGLSILVPVFAELLKKYDNITLDVYSSFDLYGWSQHDARFEPLFEQCRTHPRIAYHGAVANEILREGLREVHILAYPCILPESSCLVLMEAMSAGIVCVHPNLGGLYETAANFTAMYQFQDDMHDHAALFYGLLEQAILNLRTAATAERLAAQKAYADRFYNWQLRAGQWKMLLESLQHLSLIP
jgi:UDP-glucose:(glucosyl)LPS alpha-1,2-glucosyltransferase